MTVTRSAAANVRAEATRRDIGQSDLARVLGLSQSALSQRLRGRVEFKLSELEKIAEFMGVAFGDLTKPVELGRRDDHPVEELKR